MNKSFRNALALGIFACASIVLTVPATAQSVYGSIFGTVTDKTGAAVPGATIAVTDEAKGTVVTVTANASGDYTVSHLAPDVYDLKVTFKGFKSFETKGIAVAADVAPRIDPLLEVGGSETTVEVSADSQPLLKTDRADVATNFDAQQVNDLPIEGQNFANLQLLLPGAQLLGWSHAADENPQQSRQIQVDGQAFGGVAYELDGTDNQDPILGIIVVNPALDTITDAKITTQNFDAELGKAVAAAQTVQTKSGSNNFHGSAYDYRFGNANLARDPFSQSAAAGLPAGLKNKMGITAGGPLSKDKRFFFFGYEGQRQKSGVTNTDTLPSKLLTETCLGHETGPSGIAGCDFSEYLANLPTGLGQIFNNNPAAPVPVGAFPSNVIPTAMVSQQWINLLTLLEPYTKQESGGVLGGLASNSNGSGTGVFNSNMWVVRLDQTFSEKQTGFVRFTRWTDALGGPQLYGAAGGPGFGIGGYGGNSTSADDSLAIGTDYVVSPTLITDLRLGYLRYNIIDIKNDEATQEANNLGMPGLNTAQAVTGGSPGFFVASLPQGTQPLYGDGLNIARCNCPLTEREDQFQIVNNWTKTIGNHAVKLGADLRYGRNLRVPSDTDRTGLLDFNDGPTSNNGVDGLGFATFALGDVSTYGRYVSSSTNAKEFQKREFFYAQDTWRLNPKLTLNLGVRWELYYPESVNGPGNGSLMNLADGYLHVAGVGGIKSDMSWQLDKKRQFEPRLSAAYQLTPKTVIRLGYGRSFDIGVFGSIFGHVVTQNLPVLANQEISNSTTTGQSFCIGSPADNPGCNPAMNTTAQAQPATGGPIPYVPPSVPADGLLPNPGALVNSKARPNPVRFPTLDAWNGSIQHALTPTLTITAAYVGNKGTHTLSDGDGNNTNPNESAINLPGQYSINGQTLHWDPTAGSTINSAGGTGNYLYLQRYYGGSLKACGDPNYTQPTDPNYALPAGACGWSQQISYYGDDQNTHFNSLQITIAQSTWHGLNMNGNYQYATASDFNSGYSTWSKAVTYGNDSDVRHQSATAYGSYMLPFGKGKDFLNNANHAEDLAIGGYEISLTGNLASGLPFGLSITCATAAGPDLPSTPYGDAPCQPNATGKLHTGLSGYVPGQGWTFYKAQTLGSTFSDAGTDKIGNVRRNSYFGPAFFNTDIALAKSFDIWEAVSLKFRFDAINAVNHINPGNPGGNILGVGSITGEAPGPGPRQLEFSLRLQF
jgi:hypothetical protein